MYSYNFLNLKFDKSIDNKMIWFLQSHTHIRQNEWVSRVQRERIATFEYLRGRRTGPPTENSRFFPSIIEQRGVREACMDVIDSHRFRLRTILIEKCAITTTSKTFWRFWHCGCTEKVFSVNFYVIQVKIFS